MIQTAVKTKKPRKQAISGRFWAGRTYRGRIKDDHKIECACGSGSMLLEVQNHIEKGSDGLCYGQENNQTIYNLAQMSR